MTQPALLHADLTSTPLAEVLVQVAGLGAAGLLEVTRDDVAKRLLLRDGYVIHAASTDRGDWLASYLFRQGRISAETFASLGELHRFSKRVGALLVESGTLSPAEVLRAIREHTEAIVWSLFEWTRGEAVFTAAGPEGLEHRLQIRLPVLQVVVEGIKRTASLDPIWARLGDRETVLEASFRVEALIAAGLDRDDVQLLGLVDGQRTLRELCAAGPGGLADNARRLYAFQVLDLVRPANAAGERGGPLRIRLR